MQRLALCLALVLAVGLPSDRTPAAADASTLVPSSGAWFGAFVNPDHSDPAGSEPEVTKLESAIGRKLDVDNRFYGFGEAIPTPLETWDVEQGRIPMITWGVRDTITLASGSDDDWLRSEARALASFGSPVFLRFFHEFDGDYRRAVVHSAADFIAAWRHVHDVFVAEGATNVAWVWCPTAWKFISRNPWPPDYYPGNRYVDWIAADGYNWYPARTGSTWRSFRAVFADFYAWASGKSKPIMVAENGVQEDPARRRRKANWIAASVATLENTYPLVRAVLYFDTNVTKGGNTYPWRIDSSRRALRAFRAMGADPYFNPPH